MPFRAFTQLTPQWSLVFFAPLRAPSRIQNVFSAPLRGQKVFTVTLRMTAPIDRFRTTSPKSQRNLPKSCFITLNHLNPIKLQFRQSLKTAVQTIPG